MARKSYRVRFEGGSGFELAGIVDRPDEASESPVLVFSHCFTCNKDLKAIVRIARGLADRGIAVLRFDMTGLGGSSGDFSETSFTSNIRDLCAAIRFAGRELGEVTALMGHSFGGAASLAVAGQLEGDFDYPQKLPNALITLAAPSDTQHLAQLLARMDPNIESQGIGQVTIGGIDWIIRREMLADFREHELTAAISRVQAATLLFHSPVDATVGFDHALRIQGLIQNSPHDTPPPSLLALPGADHLLVTSAADIAFVADAAAAFVRRYALPAG